MRRSESITAGWIPMKKYQIAVVDDYQNVVLESADWSVLRDRADIAVFQDHLADPDAVIERLLPFDVVCVMRERTPLPRNVIERLPNLKLISSTGSVNASIDVAAAGDHGIAVVHTGYRSDPTIEFTWALILASARHIVTESNSVRSGGWQQTGGTDLRGKTLGGVGLGRGGSQAARVRTTCSRRRIADAYRMIITMRSTRIPARIFGSGSTPIRTRQEHGKTMPKRLEGKIAVVTGGTEGIGLATAKLFVKEGAYVFIAGRRPKELDQAVKAIGTNVSGVQGDVAQLADLDRLYEAVSKVKGQLDIVFANAGVGEFVPFGAVTEEHFDKLFNINVRGTLFTVQKALPLLHDAGSIILNGSVASVKATAPFGRYAATKAAIRSLVRTWTTDLRDRRIRSNVVNPGPINTPLASRQSPDVIARIVSTVPMRRIVEPEEIAKAALFLASDDSSFVTVIELFVDGGRAQV